MNIVSLFTVLERSALDLNLNVQPVEESGTHNNQAPSEPELNTLPPEPELNTPSTEPELNSCVSECTDPSLPIDGSSKMVVLSHSPVVNCHRFLLQQETAETECLNSYDIIA